ncbi:hypothetical protein COLO4_02317 [Corchorus olitorius]|uniref:Uncharacterized protein n=1 Tax=Corchorus olitorius TaxID=93759 RepID=A0A1R3L180_9ROSI|nr:hypothetical protein COLO4_02317 [Corchorus olitorius]
MSRPATHGTCARQDSMGPQNSLVRQPTYLKNTRLNCARSTFPRFKRDCKGASQDKPKAAYGSILSRPLVGAGLSFYSVNRQEPSTIDSPFLVLALFAQADSAKQVNRKDYPMGNAIVAYLPSPFIPPSLFFLLE